MCGVVGLITKGGAHRDMRCLPGMADLIRHRGPDGEGYAVFDGAGESVQVYGGNDTSREILESSLPFAPATRMEDREVGGAVGLAHRRLSILDLSPSGHQPLCEKERRYWIVFNGEVYNYRELKQELEEEGETFFGDSDTEVILRSYIRWGPDCQERFNGMWAILIWDNKNQELWVSRDRFGVKPLFYFDSPEFFFIGSEIKPLSKVSTLEPNLDEARSYFVDGPCESHGDTMFVGVKRFPPGHSGTYSLHSGKLVLQKYFELPPAEMESSYSERRLGELADEFRDLLEDGVRLRMRADVPISTALSGGLDSSAITLLASELLAREETGNELTTVSNIYRDSAAKADDESYFIDEVTSSIRVRSIRGEPPMDDLLDRSRKALWHYENCFEWLAVAAVNTYSLCAQNGIKVNLDGQGADEMLAGYTRYWGNYFYFRSSGFGDLAASMLDAPYPLKEKVRKFLRRPVPEGDPGRVTNRIAAEILPEYRAERVVSKTFSGKRINETLRENTLSSLKTLLRNVDCFSMFHSVESRQPFMDYRLITFLNQVPETYKMRAGWTKYLARVAFEGRLPETVVWRKDKKGWPQPLKVWMRGELGRGMKDKVYGHAYPKEVAGGLSRDEVDELFQVRPRQFVRLFNLAEQYDLFHDSHGS